MVIGNFIPEGVEPPRQYQAVLYLALRQNTISQRQFPVQLYHVSGQLAQAHSLGEFHISNGINNSPDDRFSFGGAQDIVAHRGRIHQWQTLVDVNADAWPSFNTPR